MNPVRDQRAPARTRLDKWLWAARFFKTRSLAKAAIDGGKVHVDGARGKASKEVTVGTEVRVTKGEVVQTVVVTGIAERRGSAAAAAALYAETAESAAKREAAAAARRMARAGIAAPPRRPNKRQRRALKALRDGP